MEVRVQWTAVEIYQDWPIEALRLYVALRSELGNFCILSALKMDIDQYLLLNVSI